MDLRVIGCHGGETPKHRTSAFVVDERVAIDAGALTSGLELKAQCALEAVLVSHAHLDHIRDLATIADNRSQNGADPLVIAGTKHTLLALKKHFFNNLLWPDFSTIPSRRGATIRYLELTPERSVAIAGFEVRAVRVNHTIDCCAFILRSGNRVLAYSGDTGPTDRLWQVLEATEGLKALLMEVSFPNGEGRLARVSGHHTPETLARDLKKLPGSKELPTLLYHIKPSFQAKVERECARLRGLNLTVCALGDHFIL
ncbi:MAG TPA: 3',5'-cyclic-nucleotide phosphodiesterase [Polyangiaceae bacterium]|nr:3',5'-cyclic-nucleotide phosphodiesterase [Polyangiaceae bacterium]